MTEYYNKYKSVINRECAYCGKVMPVPAWKYCSNFCMEMYRKAKTAKKAEDASTTLSDVSKSERPEL